MRTATELGNKNGYSCPKCKRGNELYIEATLTAALIPDGFATLCTEWDGQSPARCACGWHGKVKDFPLEKLAPLQDLSLDSLPCSFKGDQNDGSKCN